MSVLNRYLALLTALFAASCPHGSWAADRQIAAIETAIARGLKDWETPGLAIAIVKDDRVVLAQGYGVRELGRPERPDAHTLFAIGSTSKAFASAAIASLVDDRKINLDAPVVQYLPWFKLSDPWVTREVRVRDMLSHRVGPDLITEALLGSVSTTAADRARRMQFVKFAAPFRSTYEYSNGMYVTAGLVIESISGMPWDAYVRKRIWEPLHMTQTTTNVEEVLASDNRAPGHFKAGGVLQPDRDWIMDRHAFVNSGPSGSVVSTAADMAQWLRLQLGEGSIAGRQIISQKSFRELHTPHTPIRGGPQQESYWFTDIDATDLKSKDWSYALGWVVNDYRGHTMVWHGGSINHVRTVVAMLPDQKLGVYISGNALTMLPFVLALKTLDTYLGTADTDWSALFLAQRRKQDTARVSREQTLEAARIPDSHPSLPLDRYAGVYQDNGAFGPVQITQAGGRLSIQVGIDHGELEHWHNDVFRVHWLPDGLASPSFVTFTTDKFAVARRLELDSLGMFDRSTAPTVQ
jgi:CubicO group peptidase (beta-lactamase class C family)